MKTIFEVENQDLDRLDPQEAVRVFRDLLWAESQRLGIPVGQVTISLDITVPDGGIDASVKNPHDSEGEIVRSGITKYQIKADASFKPWQRSGIREELFGSSRKKPILKNLKPGVRDCLNVGGSYILVCFKQDLVDTTQHEQAERHLSELLADCGFTNASVDVFGQGHLIGFMKPYPSIALRVNRRERSRFQVHTSWSSEAEMRRRFLPGEAQINQVQNIQNELRNVVDHAVPVHVSGEPGIGKTRLVLEATKDDDLSSLVLYCDSASKFRDSELMNELLMPDQHYHLILVVDECSSENRSYIWNKLQHLGARIKLVTIYNEHDPAFGPNPLFEIPPLDEVHIGEVIKGYDIPEDLVGRWVDWCSGSPRVAHVIGENLRNNPDDLLKPSSTVPVWNRFITGYDASDSQEARQRFVVLGYLSLFKRFGIEGRFQVEAKAIAAMVEAADNQITWARFLEIVRRLRTQKILQGDTTLYITPKALQLWLWGNFWNTFGSGTIEIDQLGKTLPGNLPNWFNEMFEYAATFTGASIVVKQVLSESGPFADTRYLQTEQGARFFLALSSADPPSALRYLQRTIGNWTDNQLLEFKQGRREVVWALEKILVWKDLFADAAILLLQLAGAENETCGNNASGVFAELFVPRLSPTEASPAERFPVLEEALKASSPARRKVALNACHAALEARHFTRTVGSEHQGMRPEPKLWEPSTWGELFGAYRYVWNLLVQSLDALPTDERDQALDTLLERSRGLVTIRNLSGMVIDTVGSLAQRSDVSKKQILTTLIQILRYEREHLSPEVVSQLKQMEEHLTGTAFSSLLRRYVGMNLLEDRFQEDREIDMIGPQIETLAQKALDDPNLLTGELPWLLSGEAENGYRFGYELAKRDQSFSLWEVLLESHRSIEKPNSLVFLGGYGRGMAELEPDKWENELDALVTDSQLNALIPELTFRSQLTDRSALRILCLAQEDVIPAQSFALFVYGGSVNGLSEDVFIRWVTFLLESQEETAISPALSMFYSYYIHAKKPSTLPEDLTFSLLTNPILLENAHAMQVGKMVEYDWCEIAKTALQIFPARKAEIATKMLAQFGNDEGILGRFHSQTVEVLDKIAEDCPDEVWPMVTTYLHVPVDSRGYYVVQWLKGGRSLEGSDEGALRFMNPDTVISWVEESPEKRVWLLAFCIPKVFFRDPCRICWAREMLKRYGEREDVRNELHATFLSGGWTGPASSHYEALRRQFLGYKESEDEPKVKPWLEEVVSSLDEYIEHAKAEEERRGF